MKTKIILIFLAVFLPLAASILNADSPPHKQEIPINPVIEQNSDYDNRSLIQFPIECHYLSMMNAIMTTVQSDLGDVLITVTNCSTGNVWYDSFDSAREPQTMLPISGEPGVYEITYITESGNIYVGNFTIIE